MEEKVTKYLIIANIAVFLVIFSMPEAMMEQAFALLSFSGATILEPWRLLTSMFMHANASHLFFNMLALYFFGRVAEKELGAKRFSAVYFLSGIAGGIAYGLTGTTPAVGASGCIFGVMGAAMLIEPKKWIKLYLIPLPLGFIAILYVISQVALSAMPVETSGIAYIAHIGGLLAGSLLAFYFEPKRSLKGLAVMALLLALLVILWPIVGIAVGIGEFILSIIDYAVGFVLYGTSRIALGWIWTL
jgi:uncharacterized protein